MTCLFCLNLNIPFTQNSVTNCTISVNHMLYNFLDKFDFLKSHAVLQVHSSRYKKHWN